MFDGLSDGIREGKLEGDGVGLPDTTSGHKVVTEKL